MIEFVCACVFVWNKSHINTAQTTYCNPFFSVLEHVSSSIRTSFITTGVISHRLSISLTSSKRRSIKEVSIKLHHHQQQSRLQKEEIKTNKPVRSCSNKWNELKDKNCTAYVWHAANQRWMKHATENEEWKKKAPTMMNFFIPQSFKLRYDPELYKTRHSLFI